MAAAAHNGLLGGLASLVLGERLPAHASERASELKSDVRANLNDFNAPHQTTNLGFIVWLALTCH